MGDFKEWLSADGKKSRRKDSDDFMGWGWGLMEWCPQVGGSMPGECPSAGVDLRWGSSDPSSIVTGGKAYWGKNVAGWVGV